jgi:hypothetical protein
MFTENLNIVRNHNITNESSVQLSFWWIILYYGALITAKIILRRTRKPQKDK